MIEEIETVNSTTGVAHTYAYNTIGNMTSKSVDGEFTVADQYHLDFQGSITHILSAYDVDLEEQNYSNLEEHNLFKFTRRGYTGHKHLTEHYLINMDGRMYDPYLGRMLSVDNVDYFGGATLVNDNDPNSGVRWGLTLGNYINSQNVTADPRDDLFRHEYGHVLQSRLVGPLYMTNVGIPSLLGSGLDALGLHSHDDEWNEIQANRMAHRYFNKFEPASLDRTQGGTPWNDKAYPREYVYDWYFALTAPPLPFMWWLFF